MACIPPERTGQDVSPPDSRSDTYALGVLLYELLTKNRPFSGNTAAEMLSKIVNDPPMPPRRLVRSIPADLEAICLKAMAKRPDERYQTASELAGALRGFLKPRRRKGFWK
jgi:serine/threonine protein kinase